MRSMLALALAVLVPSVSLSATSGNDEATVVDTMHSMFAAYTHDDLGQFHHVACPDFYAFDQGKSFPGDTLFELIKKYHAQGNVFVWQVTEPKVHVDGNMAWITYVNRGSFADASGKKMDVSWLESAVLSRTADAWCVRFLHSTKVPSK